MKKVKIGCIKFSYQLFVVPCGPLNDWETVLSVQLPVKISLNLKI